MVKSDITQPRSAKEIAAEHRAADERMGRDWNGSDGCGCGACNKTRKDSAPMMTNTETQTTEVETMTQANADANTALVEEYYHSERDEAQECGFCYSSEQGKHGEVRRVWSSEWWQHIPLCEKHAGVRVLRKIKTLGASPDCCKRGD